MRVLQLTPYPVRPRTHGGQRRAGAIRDAYRRSGAAVACAEFWPPVLYPEAPREHLLPARWMTLKRLAESSHRAELMLAPLLLADRGARRGLVRTWRRHRPDIVHLEQPFFWPAVRELLDAGDVPAARVVYASQNVEWDMKEGVYRQFLAPGEAARAAGEVRELETDLARSAALVVAVTDEDARAFAAAGARRTAVVRNGSDVRTPSPERLAHWRTVIHSRGWASFAVFVSSYHWPNFVGFLDLVGPRMQFLPPDAGVLVVGAVTHLFEAEPAFRTAIGQGKLGLVRTASDADLAALLELAGAILLPITAGGGSNLKTVEALLTGRPIVATDFAFRAYEALAALPRVARAGDRPGFRAAVQRALLAPPAAAAAPGDELLSLTWPRLGERFVDEVRALLAEPGAGRKEVA